MTPRTQHRSGQRRASRRLRGSGLLGVFMFMLAGTAVAQDCVRDSAVEQAGFGVTLRIDNDMFGWDDQDQNYTNGLLLSVVSPNLTDFSNDPCQPAWMAKTSHFLRWLHPEATDLQNVVFSIGQGMFTPEDRYRSDLIEDDRPYAGVLFVSAGYNARADDRLRTTVLRLGVVGPAALAGKTQSEWHRIIGADRFKGWDNQLHNEPVFQLIHERTRRWQPAEARRGWGWDASTHWGGSLGNLATYANVGGEIRFGWRLPDDFGSSPLRPSGENMAPQPRGERNRGWGGHLFAAVDGRWMVHDITLDGNTFRNSHSVHKRPLVADFGYGLAVTYGPWKVAFARYHRTREFDGQGDRPVFGSMTISRVF